MNAKMSAVISNDDGSITERFGINTSLILCRDWLNIRIRRVDAVEAATLHNWHARDIHFGVIVRAIVPQYFCKENQHVYDRFNNPHVKSNELLWSFYFLSIMLSTLENIVRYFIG